MQHERVIQVIVDDLVEGTIFKAENREVRESAQELREVIEKKHVTD